MIFPRSAILGYIVGTFIRFTKFFIIKNNEVLQKGYNLTIWDYIGHQQNISILVGINNIVINSNIGPDLYGDEYFKKVTNDPNIFFITSCIDPGDFWVDDVNDLKSQISNYEITGFIGNEIVVYLAKQIQKFRAGEISIKDFDLPEILNLKLNPFADASTSSNTSSE